MFGFFKSTSTTQQAREKMSAFSLYGCLSVTSGAMLRKEPVWPVIGTAKGASDAAPPTSAAVACSWDSMSGPAVRVSHTDRACCIVAGTTPCVECLCKLRRQTGTARMCARL